MATTASKAGAAVGGKPPSGPPKAAAFALSAPASEAGAAAPAAVAAEQPSAALGMGYSYKYVTEEVAREWNKSQVRVFVCPVWMLEWVGLGILNHIYIP